MSEQHDTTNETSAKAEPKTQWMGIPIFNQHAALVVEKIGRDIDEGKLDPKTSEGRMELVAWTDLIVRTELIYGRAAFGLSAVMRKGNFPRFLAKMLGGPVSAAEPAKAAHQGVTW